MKRSFWRVRPWEAGFLLITGSLLACDALGLAGNGASATVLAMVISMIAMLFKLKPLLRLPLEERPYPSEMRWPYVVSVVCAVSEFWQSLPRGGAAAAVFGLVGASLWAFFEVFAWRGAQAARQQADGR